MTDQSDLDLLLHEPFEDPEPAAAPPSEPVARKPKRLGRPPRRLTVIVVVAVLIIAAGGGIWAATGSSAASYRSATVGMGDVDQTLNSYGTVKPINQAVVAFPVGGTVATVPVTVGEHVKVGQTLATIDKTSLQSQLDSAESTLATAQAKLASDTQAQADGTTVSSNSGGSGSSSSLGPADVGAAVPLTSGHSGGRSGGTGGTSGGSGGSDTSALQTAVTNAQAQLLLDQKAVDTTVNGISQVLTTCASFLSSLQNFKPAVTPTAGATASPATPGASAQGSVSDPNGCAGKLSAIPGLEAQVTTAEQKVAGDETALTTAIANLAAAASATPTPTPSASPSPSASTGGSGDHSRSGSSGSGSTDASGSSSFSSSGSTRTGSGGSGGGSGGGTLVTADMLALDQANVDADTAAVFVAAEAVNQATLVSPLAGTVAQIDVTPGSSVSAQATAVTVIGPGVDQVTTTVGDLDLQQVHVGATVMVTPDGTNKPVHGTVTAIGLLPVSSTSTSSTTGSGRSGASSSAASSSSSSSTSSTSSATSSATYPVTVSLDSSGLYSGSGANVSILVKSVSEVVTVPTSAVTTFGTLHTVTVLSGGKAQRKVVVVGASDATLTQITSGLKAGDHVALANLSTPLPTSGTTSLTGRGGGLGGGLGGTLTGGTGRTGGGGFARAGGTGGRAG